MRVIAGKHRGRVLAEFKGKDIRPTSDRAKEAVFNILQTIIGGSDFLDLYCGSGNMGIEALSRGANPTFVDKSPESVALTKKNLEKIKENAPVYTSDALSFINSVKVKFDVIFLDPPYKDNAEEVLKSIVRCGVLKSDGIIIYEHSGESRDAEGLERYDTRKYGVATFDFYRTEVLK
ncbi:MAG: 16S rRNA (guanine(966)-N(2))-methyltransferase RsmD [Clostridia bacterium]|nr:16S rRNA (guanine(966)-N(2))-methyltransferase RsmD [Clostridia bacterium]